MNDPKYHIAYLAHYRDAIEHNEQPLSIADFIRLLDELNAW